MMPRPDTYRVVLTCTQCGKKEEMTIQRSDKDEAAPLVSEDGVVHGVFICRECLPEAA
jgi:hypothetical protein